MDDTSCVIYHGEKFSLEWYFDGNGKKIIVTNGFRKKTDKMPKNEKDLAIKRRQDYLERKPGGRK